MKKREVYLDIVKGISILLIMSVHLPSNLYVFKSGLTFMVPSFFVVSGILMREKIDGYSVKEWTRKRCKKILVPYIIFSVATICLNILVGVFGGMFEIKMIISLFYQTLSGLGILTLWFLPALILAETMFVLAIKGLFRNLEPVVWILSGLCVLFSAWGLTSKGIFGMAHYDFYHPFSSIVSNAVIVLFQGMLGSFFVGIGYFVYPLIRCIRCRITIKGRYLLFVIAILSQALNVLAFDKLSSDIHYMKINEPVSYIVSVFLGLIAVFCFSLSIELLNISYVFLFFGKNSLIIMGTHHNLMLTNLCGVLVVDLFGKYLVNNFVKAWIIYVTLIVMESFLVKVLHFLKMDKNRFMGE